MSILVTGGLADAGERVVVLDNLSTGFDWAVAKDVPLTIGDTGDQNLVGEAIREYKIESIIHFAASIVVPDSVADPLGYYKNKTANSRALIETAIRHGVRHFIFYDHTESARNAFDRLRRPKMIRIEIRRKEVLCDSPGNGGRCRNQFLWTRQLPPASRSVPHKSSASARVCSMMRTRNQEAFLPA